MRWGTKRRRTGEDIPKDNGATSKHRPTIVQPSSKEHLKIGLTPAQKSEYRPTLLLFGEPVCLVDGIPRRIAGPPRTLALLVFLVLHRGTPMERRRIAFTLWPDADEEDALAKLRRHFHALAGTLPALPDRGRWYDLSRVSVRWTAPDAFTDVTAFEAALAAGTPERAVALYRGALCPTLDEEWADLGRARLERLMLETLDGLVERDRGSDAQRALAWATRAADVDPWRESGIRTLIELHRSSGDTASARRLYHDFAQRLEREYGAAPDPETTAAYDRIASNPRRRAPGDRRARLAVPSRANELDARFEARDENEPRFEYVVNGAGALEVVEPRKVADAFELPEPADGAHGEDGGNTIPVHEYSRRRDRRSVREPGLTNPAWPENVHPLNAGVRRSELPEFQPADALTNNLPSQTSSFVGRQREVDELCELVLERRLVTLVGSGGIGKTRTSLRVADKLAAGFEHGVWLIELAPLERGEYLPSAVARALKFVVAPDDDPGASLVRALRTKSALLVFDNCEHLIDPAAVLINAILRGCPLVKVLASSRQGLAIDGEHAYRLPPLAVPAPSDPEPLLASRAVQSEAIELFVERARAADHRFDFCDENAAAVAEICRRLDGIPLAIELAAVRMKTLTPGQLSERLDERFRVLTSGKRDALPRLQTLRAVIDWSYDLLDDRERAVLRRLSVFANGFALEGAGVVASSAELDERDVFDGLASLVDKSLILAEPAGQALRYRMLESTRAYAREKLDAAGEREVSSARHLRYLGQSFSATYERSLETCRPADLNAQFAAELDDVRAALAYARVADPQAGAELLADVDHSWAMLGLDIEGFKHCQAFLDVVRRDRHALRARLCCLAAHLAANNAQLSQAFALAVEAVTNARAGGVPEILACALRRFVSTAAKQNRLVDAESAQTEAETLAPISRVQQLRLLESRAYLARLRGDFALAADALGKLRTAWSSVGHHYGELIALIDLAEVEHTRGCSVEAIAFIQAAIVRLRRGRNRITLAQALCNLAAYSVAADDVDGCIEAASEAIREVATSDAESPLVAVALEHLALARLIKGDVALAATLAGYAGARLHDHMHERQFTERATRERLTRLLHERLAPDELEARRAAGIAMTADAALTAIGPLGIRAATGIRPHPPASPPAP